MDKFEYKGTITEDMLKKIDKLLSNPREIDEWMSYLKKKEHIFYDWIQVRSGGAISNMSRYGVDIRVSQANIIAHTLICAFLSGYIISHELTSKHINDLMMTPEQDFEAWGEGKLPSSFYDYSLQGLKKDSAKYLAKTAHIKILKIMKKKEKNHEDFSQVKSSMKIIDTTKKPEGYVD